MTLAQSTLPSTTPTTLPAATAPASTPASPIAPTHASQRAEVSYAQGQLQITADDSSLNQILREIGRLTGMTITGGVADQRVFGKYGPAAPSDILANLLQGTGSNMLLLNSPSKVPSELILTPQKGGPTPPNPNAPGFDDDASTPQIPPPYDPSAGQSSPRPAYTPPVQTQGRSRFGGMPSQDPSTGSAGNGANPPPTSEPPTPNAVQTPQQIYQQLQQLQNVQPK